jgi:hypothetical protein
MAYVPEALERELRRHPAFTRLISAKEVDGEEHHLDGTCWIVTSQYREDHADYNGGEYVELWDQLSDGSWDCLDSKEAT